MDRVAEALAQVNRGEFDHDEDGRRIIQTTASEAIERDLRLLQAGEGHRVLEIGTGSGFTAALLSQIVGKSGRVVSLDVEPDLTRRAREMFERKQIRHVRFETVDGRKGFPEEAPFDRIVAWTSTDSLPEAWQDQLAEGGIMVAPFHVLPLAGCQAVVRFEKHDGRLKNGAVMEGSYIRMSSGPVECFHGPEVDAQWTGEGEGPAWASSAWMKGRKLEGWAYRFCLTQPVPSPVKESAGAIRPFLLAAAPEGFTTASHPVTGWCLGYSTPDGFALAAVRRNEWLVTDDRHGRVLRQWWDEWGRRGKPGYEDLEARLSGGRVAVELKYREWMVDKNDRRAQ